MELGSVKEPGDWMKYQGRAHDMKGFDEICHFTELQNSAPLIGWMRTDNPDVRQRGSVRGNPPTDAEGEWWSAARPGSIRSTRNPAKDGELRWFVTDENGKDQKYPGLNRSWSAMN